MIKLLWRLYEHLVWELRIGLDADHLGFLVPFEGTWYAGIGYLMP